MMKSGPPISRRINLQQQTIYVLSYLMPGLRVPPCKRLACSKGPNIHRLRLAERRLVCSCGASPSCCYTAASPQLNEDLSVSKPDYSTGLQMIHITWTPRLRHRTLLDPLPSSPWHSISMEKPLLSRVARLASALSSPSG